MSSVSGIGGNAQSLYQFIQALSGNASTSSASSASTASGTGATSAAQSIAQVAQSVGQAAQSIGQAVHGHHHHQGGALKEIQDAVTTALQSAQSSGSNADPNKIIESAIAQVLSGGSGAASGTDSDGDNDASATAPTINTQNFFQKLQAFGVTPQQFQQDLLSAVKDAQNGTVNSSTAFQSFPLGSALNVVG